MASGGDFVVGLFKTANILVQQDGGSAVGSKRCSQRTANAVGSAGDQYCPAQ